MTSKEKNKKKWTEQRKPFKMGINCKDQTPSVSSR